MKHSTAKNMTVSSNLKYYLRRRGMTQRELAKLIGVTESAVCHYVKGNRQPSLARATEIASVLDIPVDFLAKELDRHANVA